MDINNYDIS
jgi:tubulin polyglutamylase TTLL6/13